jgi:hypothetical protein
MSWKPVASGLLMCQMLPEVKVLWEIQAAAASGTVWAENLDHVPVTAWLMLQKCHPCNQDTVKQCGLLFGNSGHMYIITLLHVSFRQ